MLFRSYCLIHGVQKMAEVIPSIWQTAYLPQLVGDKIERAMRTFPDRYDLLAELIKGV